ncbi:MAG TPA: phospholipid carrier-dependent glycosyltransferase [Acidothermaceae bacterium]
MAGSALCFATGTLAYQLCRKPDRRARIAAWCAALAVGVAYTAFRMSEYAHPEIEQALFATLSLVGTAMFVRGRQFRWALFAGVLAGVAGAIKYIGGFSLLPVLVAVVLTRDLSWRRRASLAALASAAASLVFVALVPGAILRWSRFCAGVQGQFSHQATGHLGYDSSSPALWFHLTQSIPGSVGWPLTIAILCGTVAAVWKGDAPARLTFLFVVVALGALGLSRVRFPHYALVALPAVLALGFSGLTEVLPKGTAQYDGRVFKEAYTDTSDVGQAVGTIASVPDIIDCHCYVVLSSYMESRYRLEPQRYAAEISVYDHLRRVGQVVADIRPAVPLSYRWDLLPQYGLDHVAFGKQLVGPEITVLKIP